MSASETMSHDEAISQFCGVTGADEDRARGLLEACEWNLELAINMHVDTDPEGRSNKTAQQQQQQQSTSSSSSANQEAANSAGASSHRPTQRNFHSNDNDGDDEDSLTMGTANNDIRGGRFAARHNHSGNHAFRRFGAGTSAAEPSSASAAEASNAYSNLMDTDGVRAPIAPVRQILNPNPIGYPTPDMPQTRRYNTRTGANVSNVYDAFRDFQAEAEWQEMLQEGEADANGAEGRRTLEELFRPPLELMFRGAFTNARESGTSQNKWLLVNIQNGREFACQVLNRDVWSHQTVKDIIKEHFIFWQVYHDSYEGQRYVHFYHVKKLPHVAIIDPRTGELMRSWPTSIDHNSFCDSVIEFLTEHPSPDGSAADANTMKKIRVKEDDDADEDIEPQVIATRTTLYDQSEEAQLEAAIRASLQEPEKIEINDDTIEIDDDTIEASDVSEPDPLLTRDKDPVEMSSVSGNNSKQKNMNFHTNQNNQESKVSSENYQKSISQANKKSNNSTTDEDKTTAAEALNAVAIERSANIDGLECKIALRFPDGSSHIQKFGANDRLFTVKEFVQMGKPIFRTSKIEFVAPPNRKLTESMMDETLESLGLCPASRLEVKFVQD